MDEFYSSVSEAPKEIQIEFEQWLDETCLSNQLNLNNPKTENDYASIRR